MKQHRLVCITGLDGVGKSTLLNSLREQLPGSVKTTIWDMLRNPEMADVLPARSPQDIDRFLTRLHTESRSLFLLHCLREALSLAMDQQPAVILADSYWYKYVATELTYGADRGYLQELVRIFPVPDVLFTIRLPQEAATARKQHYSRYECGGSDRPDAAGFLAFQRKASKELELLLTEVPPACTQVALDGSLPVSENLTHVLNVLRG